MSCSCSSCTRNDHNSSYLSRIYDGQNYVNVVDRVIRTLTELKRDHQIDSVAFQGSSGAAVAFTAAWATDLRLLHVRKRDGNHAGVNVEGFRTPRCYVIIDDFIGSGDTMARIITEIHAHAPLAKLCAVVCWNADDVSLMSDKFFRAIDYHSLRRLVDVTTIQFFAQRLPHEPR